MKRIYVAGPYSADNVLDVLGNMRRGMRVATEILLRGDAPFCPWLDYHFVLMLQHGENLSVDDFYKYSLAWLEASDAVVVLPNSEKSKGVKQEIERAKQLKIPVFNWENYSSSHMIKEVKKITDYQDFTALTTPIKKRQQLGVGDIWANKARCKKCGDIPRSRNRHDYRECACGNLAVDGGSWYLKRIVKEPGSFEELSTMFTYREK